MIRYDNGKQFLIIFHTTGSVLPSCLPVGLFCFSLGLALALFREFDNSYEDIKNSADKGGYWFEEDRPLSLGTIFGTKYISDPFALTIIATVIGYLLVVRTNMALSRWMEGISDIQMMLSKWGDAYDALSAFFAGKDGTTEQLEEILFFRIRVAHWLALMSCLAFATLRGHGTLGPLAEVPIREILEELEPEPQGQEAKPKRAKSFAVNRIGEAGDTGRISTSSSDLDAKDGDRALPPKMMNMDSMACNPGPKPSPGGSRQAHEHHYDASGVEEINLADNIDLKVLSIPTAQEVALLDMSEDKPNTICLWIIQGVILMVRKKLLDIPPPIVSRIFQELSNGMLGFNQAHKVAMVPFPFPFAQMVSLLLCILYVMIPFYIDLFTQNVVITPIVSFILPVVYCALNNIAIELEEPFGLDYNDVDIEVRHEEFIWLLIDVIRAPRLPPMHDSAQHETEILKGVFREALHVAEEFDEFLPQDKGSRILGSQDDGFLNRVSANTQQSTE